MVVQIAAATVVCVIDDPNLRVFGSVARGQEHSDSDIDLLVDVAPEVGLLGLARLQGAIEDLLQASVDLVPDADLKPGLRAEVEGDLVVL